MIFLDSVLETCRQKGKRETGFYGNRQPHSLCVLLVFFKFRDSKGTECKFLRKLHVSKALPTKAAIHTPPHLLHTQCVLFTEIIQFKEGKLFDDQEELLGSFFADGNI